MSFENGSPVGSPAPTRKRKRQEKEYDELEIDVAAPEPPSKKTLRRAKKGKTADAEAGDTAVPKTAEDESEDKQHSRRSEHGVWIGNLPWSAGKPELTKFILENTKLQLSDISRVHMPAPAKDKDRSQQKLQAQNKGFAYVDFTTEAACKSVVELSEKLLAGRRLLIKNAKSFDGRPDTTPSKGNPPNERVFVGNLSFETTQNNLKEHFSRCGDVASAFVATFEDSGQCKGYAWVTFKTVESAAKAVRGWVDWTQEDSEPDEDNESKKKAKKPRKWWVNKLQGRSLRIEFAEAATVRYQKRFGKGNGQSGPIDEAQGSVESVEPDIAKSDVQAVNKPKPKSGQSPSAKHNTKPRVDARTIAPGAALSKAPRQSAAIVASAGRKVTFE